MTGWLDTNVVLRYLLNDHENHSQRAASLIKDRSNRLKVAPFIVAEAVYVLESHYEFNRAEIRTALTAFSQEPNVEFDQEGTVLRALIDYETENVDFAGALLMSVARDRAETVWTFNRKDFVKMAGAWEEPR